MPFPTIADPAIEQYESFFKSDPNNLPLNMELGDLYQKANNLAEAAACYKRCLRLRPGYPPARSRLAGLLMTQHQYAEAEVMLKALLSEGESAPEMLHNLGVALHFQQRWEEASSCFAELAQRDACSSAGFGYWARTLRHLDDFQGAIDATRRWLATAGDPAMVRDAKSYLAQLLYDTGDEAEGRRLADEVLADWPDNGGAHAVLGMVAIGRHDAVLAAKHFDCTVADDPDSARGWQGLGMARFHQQDLSGAIFALERAAALSPQALGTLLMLGWARLLSGDFAGAAEVFASSLEVDRNFGESHGGLASALALQGEMAEAEREARLARRLSPGSFGADFAEATLLAARGQRESADDVIGKALRRPLPGGSTLADHLRVHALRQSGGIH